MRSIPIFFVLALASRAIADPGDEHVAAYGLDPELVPPECRAVVTGTRMAARISVADCMAQENLEKLSLDASESSVASVRNAVARSFELLDSVATVGTPTERVEALRAESDLYTGMVSRMRRTAPNLAWYTTGKQLAEAQATHRAIEIAVAPWRDAARAADDTIVRISRAHPEIARDPIAHVAITQAVARR